jgi:hypothetical protein
MLGKPFYYMIRCITQDYRKQTVHVHFIDLRNDKYSWDKPPVAKFKASGRLTREELIKAAGKHVRFKKFPVHVGRPLRGPCSQYPDFRE